jgi:hypothetical protein
MIDMHINIERKGERSLYAHPVQKDRNPSLKLDLSAAHMHNGSVQTIKEL